MKKITSLMAMLSIFALGGCSMGFVPTGLGGSKPYLQYWTKEEMTPESRRTDSFECGGSRSDSQPFDGGNEKKLTQPGETIWETRARLRIQWANCMKSKSYRYTEK